MSRRGFTLIELLIVVAIIGILAAIAIPNFLQAQVRAKVASTKAEMRSIASALELYQVDSNFYPPMGEAGQFGYPTNFSMFNGVFHSRVPSLLSTPIDYVSSIDHDTFKDPERFNPSDPPWFVELQRRYVYFFFRQYLDGGLSVQARRAVAGEWMLYSWGPDKINFDFSLGHPTYLNYDPTNGTISYGNIIMTQKNLEKYDGVP